jgi:hypothetical protein
MPKVHLKLCRVDSRDTANFILGALPALPKPISAVTFQRIGTTSV